MSNRAGTIVHYGSEKLQAFELTKLDVLGKSESFLEQILEQHPGLLLLENRRTNIQRPFRVFRQLSLPTPSGRTVYPDIAMLTASGHIVVVEVKLGSNPELRNRSVIAQVIEYCAAISELDDEQVHFAFDPEQSCPDWHSFIAASFAGESNLGELAGVLRGRMRNGEINIVIACDSVPEGLNETIRGLTTVSPLSFELTVVEIAPYVNGQSQELMFIPSLALNTEIVARTTVRVAYETNSPRPKVRVEADSVAAILENLQDARSSRRWSVSEVEEAFRRDGSALEIQLFEFCRDESVRGQCVSFAEKKTPTCGFTLDFPVNGNFEPKMAFYVPLGYPGLSLMLSQIRQSLPQELTFEFQQNLATLFGPALQLSAPMPTIRHVDLEGKTAEFFELMRWLKSKL